MAAGVPVICSNFPAWQEIIDSTGSGITVEPLVPEAIAAAILRLLQDPTEVIRMGLAGRAAALIKYNWEAEEKVLLSLYSSLLINNASPYRPCGNPDE